MPILVTADDIKAALAHTNAAAANIDAAVDACTALDPLLRAQWKTYYAGYQAFAATAGSVGFFTLGLPNLGDQIVAYEKELASWNAVIAAHCTNLAPGLVSHEQGRAAAVSLDTSEKILIGAGILALLVFAVRR